MGSVSAVDLNNASDCTNLLNDDKITISSQDLEISGNDSLLEGISQDDEGSFQSQYVPEDILVNGTVLTLLDGNDTELYFNSGNSFKILLSDVNGNPLTDQSVIFMINGNNYTRTTNENGMASININLNSGSYDIVSYYGGTDVFEPCSATNIIKVLSTISGKDIEKYYRSNTQYYATFVNSQGALLNNVSVSFNINGVYYERRTNENGTARLNINLISGDYILTAINPATGEMISNNITVLSTLDASDIVKYYKNNTQYLVYVLDDAGKPLFNQNVTFNINGVYYDRITDSNGIAKLNINLNPGNYTITAISSFNNEMHSNNIEVLPTISASDLTMSYKDGSRFCAHVLDDTGNPLTESNVNFNINGVSYTRVSDNEGNAYLNINLEVGNYVITSTNEKGLSASNEITISKSNSIIDAYDAYIVAGLDSDYTVTLCGLNNNTIPLNTIDFKYNGVALSAVTNENGKATIVISNLSIGNYSLECEFKGNMNYYPSKSHSTLVVGNPTTILTGHDLKMIYRDGSKFKVTLTDLNSVPMANETIAFNLNGKLYDRTTDENGVASLSIDLMPGTHKISYSYSDVGDMGYNKGSNTIVVSKIPAYLSTNDLSFNYGENKSFAAVLTDAENNPLENIDVTFKISGRSYTRTTNSLGIAELHIGLPVGDYAIETSMDNPFYTAKGKSNHILVNGSVFVANDLSLISGLTRDYSVTLLNPYGKPISNAVIEFSYNGISKRATTNAKGVATVTVGNLPKGDFAIVYSYVGGNNVGQSHISVSQSVLNKKNTISDLSPYLSSSDNCQVSNSEIVSLAKRLTEGLTNPLDKAYAIFDYVRDEISYSYYYDTKYGAVRTLHAKVGNCVDQSHLSIALYRAAGLPARYVHGSCVFNSGTTYGHVWSQVLIGDTWVVSDTINSANSLGNVVNWKNNNYELHGYYYSLPF